MMAKLSQMKNKLFRFLSKQPVTSFSFQNPTLSPSKGCRSPSCKVSIIPKEARKRHRIGSFSAREPSSPKVSCMGQVKCKKKRKAQKQKRVQTKKPDYVPCHEKKDMAPDASQVSPSLGAMKKLASGRGSLYDFDVTLAAR
ncbi:hypothetical protein RJT34_30586 [Clitoria ternatea]|uniref:Uncharacterized protein n=1 Tax=Clitoria ternatea TaxID=43366 RepID=A0AAN9I243_CLITE